MKLKTIEKVVRYKAGYEVRTEIMDDSEYGGDGHLPMKSAYTPNGDYIGDPKTAKFLIDKGIQPQKISPDHNICSIGYCTKDGKWYGWSHRAIFGFKVGSKVKKGDCAYHPKNKIDFKEDCLRFWKDESHSWTKAKYEKDGIRITWKYNDESSIKNVIDNVFQEYPEEFGRGEWIAKTTADAKQMAIDFARGVN